LKGGIKMATKEQIIAKAKEAILESFPRVSSALACPGLEWMNVAS